MRRPLVALVDDDFSVCESLPELLQHEGFVVRAFHTGEAFLSADIVDATDCMVLDVGLPGMSGPDLQDELARRGKRIPIVFITGTDDAMLGRRLIAAGAVRCLFKPFDGDALIEAVNTALVKR